MKYFKIDGHHFYNMVVNGSNKLEEQRDFVNSLNVFPVPDGDTGTNMSMTFKSAVSEIENYEDTSIGAISKKVARGALMGARGNSGVILSQIFRGISKGLEEYSEVDKEQFANCLIEGAKTAYKAVMRPTEGTILTIIRAAAEKAKDSVSDNITDLMKEVCEYCEITLNKTPEMLPVLKKAKVVDAGGMGLLIIFKGMLEALESNLEYSINKNVIQSGKEVSKSEINQEIKFGYCTEFFVNAKNADVDAFKKELVPHGDSMIVVSFEDIIKVHIHTNDPGLILSKAVKLGELTKVKIDNMREQHRHINSYDQNQLKEKNDSVEEAHKEEKEYAFISIAMGEGISSIFDKLGVDIVIEGGQTMNPSTQDILDSINKLNSKNIFVLPNNKNIIMAANQAAELSDKNIIVIPTKTIPQGITAITMFNNEVNVNENVNNMKEAIANVKTGSVTYAVRDTEMDGKNIKEGDILGLIEGKISNIGKDVYNVCNDVLSDMVDEDSELITIFYGKDCDADKVQSFAEELEEKYTELDIQCIEGSQPLYYFIVSVE